MRKRDELTDPNSCLSKARDDEILFVLLARDEATPGTIRDWIARRIKLGLNRPGDAKLLEAERAAGMIEAEHRERERSAHLAILRAAGLSTYPDA